MKPVVSTWIGAVSPLKISKALQNVDFIDEFFVYMPLSYRIIH